MKNKFYLFALSAAALMSASCANDVDLTSGTNGDGAEGTQQPIGFQFLQKNGTRADVALNETNHYNFGMFAYKTGGAGDVEAVMNNYLVGYGDATNKKGYLMTAGNQTTWGESDNKSLWAYEKLGFKEYQHETNAGEEHYFTKDQTAYMSNLENQYLKYFDFSSEKTDFYAYAPYVNTTDAEAAKRVSFDNEHKIMTFPKGVIKECVYNDDKDVSLVDFMYARTQVPKDDYKKDVQLQFKRLNSKVNIQFYEQVAGYKVKLIDLKEGTYSGITMVPAKKNGSTYSYGTLYKEAGTSTIKFDENATENPTINLVSTDAVKYGDTEYVTFKVPTTPELTEDKNTARESGTTYYIIPFNNASTTATENSGLTFHVSYELEAEDTHEIIRVYDARVHVPELCCHWESNKLYTYTFKITKSSTGSTDSGTTVNPSDPGTGTQALYPIVFDNVQVADWEAVDDEHTITE